MFIKVKKKGYKEPCGEQFCHGLFLMVFSHPERNGLRPELRGLVRYVKMSQLGHFMMASVKIGGYNLSLSGSYGSDGLPIDLRQHFIGIDEQTKRAKFASFTMEQKLELWEHLVPIPAELQTEFWEGGGHNTCGKEANSFRKWALENIGLLRNKFPKLNKA